MPISIDETTTSRRNQVDIRGLTADVQDDGEYVLVLRYRFGYDDGESVFWEAHIHEAAFRGPSLTPLLGIVAMAKDALYGLLRAGGYIP